MNFLESISTLILSENVLIGHSIMKQQKRPVTEQNNIHAHYVFVSSYYICIIKYTKMMIKLNFSILSRSTKQ